MLRAARQPVILFHGRFQPPHRGHFALLRWAREVHPDCRLVVSLDARDSDEANPYSIELRRQMFLDEFGDEVLVLSHDVRQCERVLDYPDAARRACKVAISEPISHVLAGPDFPEVIQNYWKLQGIPVLTPAIRFPGPTATQLRQRNISLLVGFPCPYKCWYCIEKQLPAWGSVQETDWDKLGVFLRDNQHKRKLSVSGGGDPLFASLVWWDRLFDLCLDYGMRVDVHSRTQLYSASFWRRVRKVVVSSDIVSDCADYVKFLAALLGRSCDPSKVRVSHVVTAATTAELLREYIRLTQDVGCQLTLKRLVGHDDGGRYDQLKQQFPEQYWLETGDYNLYYTPDNRITDGFSDRRGRHEPVSE